MTGIEMALLSGLGSALLKGGAQAFGAASAAGDLEYIISYEELS